MAMALTSGHPGRSRWVSRPLRALTSRFMEVDMDVRQLEALLAVAEAGSFTEAADLLHTVQSNVSEHVRQLEAELGVQLLVRGRRGTVPTEFGVRVLDRAHAIRAEIDALHKDV